MLVGSRRGRAVSDWWWPPASQAHSARRPEAAGPALGSDWTRVGPGPTVTESPCGNGCRGRLRAESEARETVTRRPVRETR